MRGLTLAPEAQWGLRIISCSIQLREFSTQTFSILLVTPLGIQELAEKLLRQSSVVASLLKVGDESLLPLDCDLALGYVPLG